MSKSNFDKLAKQKLFARPPTSDEGASPIAGYGAVRAADGRSARRTGRTVQFATVDCRQSSKLGSKPRPP